MSTQPTFLKMITSKNRPAVVEAIQKTIGQKDHIVDKKPEGLMVVTQDNEKYWILVGYDSGGRSIYSLKRYYTPLESAQNDAEMWTLERVLEIFLNTVGLIEDANEKVELAWRDLREVNNTSSLDYYSKRVSRAQGVLELVRIIWAVVENSQEDKWEVERTLNEIQKVLMMSAMDFVQYNRWIRGESIGITLVAGTRAAQAAEWYKDLGYQIKQVERTQLKLMAEELKSN